MKKTITLLGMLICLFSLPTLWAQESLKLEANTSYELLEETNSTTTMTMMGQEMEMLQNQNSTSLVKIKDIKNDVYEFSVMVTQLKANVSQMGQEASFDSEDPEDETSPLAIAYKEVINQEKTQKMDAKGTLIIDKDTDEEMAMNMQQTVGMFLALPDNLNEGSTWTEDIDFKSDALNMTGKRNYKVIKVNGDMVTLQVSGDLVMKQDMVNQGQEVKSDLNGNVAGEMTLNKNSSMILESQMLMNMEGNTQTMGMNIPIKVRTNSKTTAKKM